MNCAPAYSCSVLVWTLDNSEEIVTYGTAMVHLQIVIV
jgi:hypothetical protein